ncbi:TRADD-N-associated membrane domain-containing protein [Streptomyces sp. NPDC004561]
MQTKSHGRIAWSAATRQALLMQQLPTEREPLLWRDSKEFKDWMEIKRGFTKVLVYSAAPMIWISVLMTPLTIHVGESTWSRAILLTVQVAIFLGALIILLIGTFGYMAARRAFDDRVRQANSAATEEAVERLRKSQRIRLADLFVINRRQLDEYQAVSIAEQHAAFRNAQIASAVGFIFLVVGVGLSFGAHKEAAIYTSAGLAGLGSLLSGFVSAVFFKQYSATTKQLQRYYTEPFRMGQILTAERIACLDDHGSVEEIVASQLRRSIVETLIGQLPAPYAASRDRSKQNKIPKGVGGRPSSQSSPAPEVTSPPGR